MLWGGCMNLYRHPSTGRKPEMGDRGLFLNVEYNHFCELRLSIYDIHRSILVDMTKITTDNHR